MDENRRQHLASMAKTRLPKFFVANYADTCNECGEHISPGDLMISYEEKVPTYSRITFTKRKLCKPCGDLLLESLGR